MTSEIVLGRNSINEESFFVDSHWLKDKMDQNTDNMIILDVPYYREREGFEAERTYETYHLPGAIEIFKTEYENKENNYNLFSAEVLTTLMLNKGISNDTLLVVYSDKLIGAGRVAFIAYWLGVDNVKILDGGIKAWIKEGYPVDTTQNQANSILYFGKNTPARPEILISTPKVIKEKQKDSNFILASIRAWEEYVGERSGYTYIDGSGSPYNSVYAKASTEMSNVSFLTDSEEKILPIGKLNEIFSEWKEWNIDNSKEIAFFCGTGWRATIPFFITTQLGWENVKLYDGGWYYWLEEHRKSPSGYPIQQGNPKEGNTYQVIDK